MPGGTRESEQVRETAEDYLNWYMNRTQYDIMDKMEELEESIEQDCSWLLKILHGTIYRVIHVNSHFTFEC